MIESLFVMNEGGEVLIEKHYRAAHTRAVAETFVDHVKLAPRPEDTCPVIAARNVYLVHVFRYRLFFLAALSAEAAPMMVLEFLQRVVEVLFDYFGGAVNEAAVRDNFVTIYQILDEMLDNGCAPARPAFRPRCPSLDPRPRGGGSRARAGLGADPLITEVNILQEMVKPKSTITRIADKISVSGQAASRASGELPEGVHSDVPWRKAGVKYANNEVRRPNHLPSPSNVSD